MAFPHPQGTLGLHCTPSKLNQCRYCLLPAAIMIIYLDLISHDEMFSNIYKIERLQTSCA